jgi:hypothetical protein
LDVPEVASSLGMSKGAVRKAIARGTMAASVVAGSAHGGGKLKGHYQVAPEEVERYRAEHLGRVLGRKPGAKGGS